MRATKILLPRSLAAVFLMMLGACQSPQLAAYRSKVEAQQAWAQQNGGAVQTGRMKQSEYWAGAYGIVTRPPVLQQDLPVIKITSKMIDLSKDLEAGRISQDEFDSKKRELLNAGLEENAAIQQQQAAADDQRRRTALDFYLRSRPVTTNCSAFGSNASCTTY
ncbi:hypothetical protein [Ralstonia thomasii]